MNYVKKDYTFDDLTDIIRLLRSENGCPWDRVQTHDSIKGNLIEEAYEAVEALDSGNKDAFADELGDVLLQVVFHSQIGESEKTFTFDDVLRHVCSKMVSRHSHIFGTDVADTPDAVLDTWEKNKQKEKGLSGTAQSMKDVCHYLPSLMRAQKIVKKAAKAGTRRKDSVAIASDLKVVADKLALTAAQNDSTALSLLLGDLLLNAADLARSSEISAEDVLNQASDRFIDRFDKIEQEAKKSETELSALSDETLDSLWKTTK